MTTFRHILVATDFSPPAVLALDLGIELATKLEANLTLVHVWLLPERDYGILPFYEGSELEQAAQKTLDETVAQARNRFPKIEGVLASGEAPAEILAVAKARDVSVILIGTHGRNWLSRVVLGSVAERVVRLSPIPVLTVPVAERSS